jgi:hypothetical protein
MAISSYLSTMRNCFIKHFNKLKQLQLYKWSWYAMSQSQKNYSTSETNLYQTCHEMQYDGSVLSAAVHHSVPETNIARSVTRMGRVRLLAAAVMFSEPSYG